MIGDIIPSFIPFFLPLFPRDIKDEKRNEGKREEHVKNVKRLAGEAEQSYLCHRRHARCFAICSYKRGNESSIVSYIIIMGCI